MARKLQSDDAQGAVVTEKRVKTRLQRPRLYRVLLHNDDFTTMEFVVSILMSIFRHGESQAVRIMLHVHNRGVGVAGVFTRELAEAKVEEVTRAAERAEFPLLCTMEPDERADGDGDSREGAAP